MTQSNYQVKIPLRLGYKLVTPCLKKGLQNYTIIFKQPKSGKLYVAEKT